MSQHKVSRQRRAPTSPQNHCINAEIRCTASRIMLALRFNSFFCSGKLSKPPTIRSEISLIRASVNKMMSLFWKKKRKKLLILKFIYTFRNQTLTIQQWYSKVHRLLYHLTWCITCSCQCYIGCMLKVISFT